MSSDHTAGDVRKPYEQPAMRKLSAEQVKMLLLGQATAGNQDAKELLEMLFYPGDRSGRGNF